MNNVHQLMHEVLQHKMWASYFKRRPVDLLIQKSDKLNAEAYCIDRVLFFKDRIVRLNSITIEALPSNELKFIIAHELTHIYFNDSKKALWPSFAMLVFVLFIALTSLSFKFLPLLIALVFSSKIRLICEMYESRRREYRADKYAAKICGKESAKKILNRFSDYNQTLMSSHPSPKNRIKQILAS